MKKGRDKLYFVVVALCICTSFASGAKWHTIESAGFHTPREETAFAACGGNDICLLGGRNVRKTQVLNTKTITWSEGSEPPLEIHHFQGVTGPDGCAWILGAWTGKFPGEAAVHEIYRYCSETSKWEVVGQMSRPRGAGGAIYYNGYFYVVSGNVGGHQAIANVVPWFDRYDPKKMKWTEMPDMPHPRDHLNVAVIDNKLYAIGGRDSGGANYPDFFDLTEEKVDVFDFTTNSWSTFEQDFPEPRAGSPVVVYENQIWVAGGEGSGKAWDEVSILDGSRFRDGPKMPNPRHGFGMVSCNNVVWVAGGAGTQGGGYSQTMLDAYYDGSSPNVCTFSKDEKDNEEESLPVSTSPTPAQENTPSDTSAPSSSPSEAGNSYNERACFPGHSAVKLEDGSVKLMEDLNIGDKVLVEHPDIFSDVYFFSHRHKNHVSNFISLTMEGGYNLHLSDRHFIYSNNRIIEAKNIKIGDKISIAHEDGQKSVQFVQRIRSKGLFNPHTLHGDIIVDGVAASTYSGTVHPHIARVLLKPFQFIYHSLGPHPAVKKVNDHVLSALERFVWQR